MEIREFNYNIDALNVLNLWNEVSLEENIYMSYSFEEFDKFLFKNPHFKDDGAFVCYIDNKLIGFAHGIIRNEDIDEFTKPGYFNTIMVKKEYRRRYIGTKLYNKVEEYFIKNNRSSVRCVFFNPINWPWYIPNTNKHNHPGMPGIRINSLEYYFLLRMGYFMEGQIDAFHLDLEKYEMSQDIIDKIEENKKRNIVVEVFDKDKHYGVEEFCENINNPGFARAIKSNLAKEKPYPFLIASNNGLMVGWTGPMYTEATGRGHLDGITVDPNVRGGGLGKILFNKLCEYSKMQGSRFMSFFTGLENPARYIYLSSGFRIVQSFAILKKEIK